MVRWGWVNFQCWGILEQGPIALAVGVGRGCLTFYLSLSFFAFSLSERQPDID